jgi:hypothetical protein
MMVYHFAKIAPAIDVNAGGKVRNAAFGDWRSKNPAKQEGRYSKFSPLGQAYSLMANTSTEPDKFVPALITYMTSKGYGGLYLTDRDPVKEAAARGHGEEYGSDIEWHYVVTLGKNFGVKPKVDVYHDAYYGGPDGSTYQKFVKKASIPVLAAKEEEEQRKRIAAYEKEQKEKEEAKGKPIDSAAILENLAVERRKTKAAKTRRSQPGTRNYIKGLKGLK